MTPTQKNWQTKDGLKIHCRVWENESAEKELWIVHGTGDHGGRYETIANEFLQNGYRVIAADHRGNGLSEGKRGHVPKFDVYLDDLELAIQQTKTDRQAHVMGQSMGSLILARFLATRNHGFDKAILLSPMFRTPQPPPPFKMFLARLVRHVYPSLTLRAGFKSEDLTSNENRKAEYRKDELKHDWVSAELGLAMFEQGESALNSADQIGIPTLVMHGDIDKITSAQASKEFAKSNHQITLKIWKDMRHELYNESDWEEVFEFMLNWLSPD